MGRNLRNYSMLLFKLFLLTQLYCYHNLEVDAFPSRPENSETCDERHHHNETYFKRETEEHIQRTKRPARMIPAKYLSRKEKSGTEDQNIVDSRFYGPASSCFEINRLGYTLNGYYLVKGKNQTKNDQVEVLGCRFKHPDGSKEVKEVKVGFIEIEMNKSTKSVERKKRAQKPSIKMSLEAIEHIDDRPKRPARLLPLTIILGKSKNNTEIFYGPASSCEELGKLGYTLNGLYLVDCKDKSLKGTKIELIECRFKHPRRSKEVKEERIGFVKIKTKKANTVHRIHLNTFMETRPTETKTNRQKIIIQRPARLLPLQLLYGKEKNDTEENQVVERFYGPPNNCSELGKLGYTLNGYYVVNGIGSVKIEIAICKFHHPFDVTGSFKEERLSLTSTKGVSNNPNKQWIPLPLDHGGNESYLLINVNSAKCLESGGNKSSLLIQTECNPNTTKRWKKINNGKQLCDDSAKCISLSFNDYQNPIPALLPMLPENHINQHLSLKQNLIKLFAKDLCVAAAPANAFDFRSGIKFESCDDKNKYQKWIQIFGQGF